ncbi:hypothetical protein GR184_11500 [Bacillus sp. BGMRC0062]|nr:hypothetical protein [Bacillus sp. BGMRC0062]
MATITTRYNIPSPVPFCDVELLSDNRLFLDPHRIRASSTPQPFASDAVAAMDTFIDHAVHAICHGSAADQRRAQASFESFPEPRETRLGLSRSGCDGHGGSSHTGLAIYRELSTNLTALLEVGVLKRLEHLPLFVPDVGHDITSDITTRLVFPALAAFTSSMISVYPQMSGTLKKLTCQVWDAATLSWVDQTFTLPSPDGKPLLLVPRRWTGKSLTLHAERYYNCAVLTHAQREQTTVLPDGTALRPPKYTLQRQPGLRRGRGTHIAVTERAYNSGSDLVANFENWADTRSVL